MTEITKKQLRGEKTKKRILDVALRLFAEKGFNKVTVDDIVKKSKTSKGSFYQHFRTKPDVFLVRFKEVDTFYLEVYKSLPEDMDPIEKLTIFSQKLMRFLEEEMGKDLMKVIYSAALESDEHTYFLESNRYLFKIMRRLLEEAIEKDRVQPEFSIEDTLTMVTQAYMGAIYHWGLQATDRSLESFSMPLMLTLLKGISK